jgi:hypothetical protein
MRDERMAAGDMKRTKAMAKPSRRSFDGKAFKYDLELACDAIGLVVGKRIKEALTDRVTDAEVKDLSRRAVIIVLLGLLGNPKVMRHVANARTSQDKRKLKKGKSKPLVGSQVRAVELRNEGLLAKQIPDQLVTEGLAVVLPGGGLRLKGMKRAIPPASWDSSLTRWAKKVIYGA